MARHKPPFDGIWPAMVTPFDADDRVNLPMSKRLVGHFIEQGAGGLYVCGSTGEAPLLRIEERKAIAECVVKEVAGQIPVIVHVGQTSPQASLELAEHADQCGADAISSVFPPFYGYTTGQIMRYWSQFARVTDLPFYGYVILDIGHSRDAISQWVEAVQSVPNLVGLKITHPDTYIMAMLKSCSGGRLNVFSGADEGYLAFKAHGADGTIGASYNIALPLWLKVKERCEAGDLPAATEIMLQCAQVAANLLSGYFLTRLKRVLKRQGYDCGLPREPLRADKVIPEDEIDTLLRIIES